MIQLRQIEKDNENFNKQLNELGKVLNFLSDNNIDYDLEPSVRFVRKETQRDCTYIITEKIALTKQD